MTIKHVLASLILMASISPAFADEDDMNDPAMEIQKQEHVDQQLMDAENGGDHTQEQKRERIEQGTQSSTLNSGFRGGSRSGGGRSGGGGGGRH